VKKTELRALIAGVALIATAMAFGQTLPTNELFVNGDVEQFRDEGLRPQHWGQFRSDTRGVVGVDKQAAFSGTVSITVENPDTEARGGWSRRTVMTPSIEPGAVVLFAGHYRTENVVSGQNLGVCARLTFVNAARKVHATHYARGEVSTAGWRRTETLLELPDDIRSIHPVLFLYGSGKVWWDAVSLRCYRPDDAVQIIKPLANACVAEHTPTFSWQRVPGAVSYALELSTSLMFDVGCTERVEGLTEPHVQLTKPLTEGTEYHWRVRARMADGSERISLLERDGNWAFHTFFAGSWELRSRAAHEKLAHYRRIQAELVRFAEKNRMWERFVRLQEGIVRLEGITAAATTTALQALTTLDADFADLDHFVTWWQEMFLSDAALLDALDLSQPGLEATRTAWQERDVDKTLRELLVYFRARQRPVCFFDTGNRPTPPVAQSEPRVVPQVDQLCRHLYPIPEKLYGKKEFDFGPGFNWHVNPIVDREWPTQIHRHKRWEDICSAYWISYNERYAEEWRQQLLDWTKDNPIERWNPKTKRMAWSTLNAAARMIHQWPAALLQMRSAAAFDEVTLLVFLKGIQQHARFLMEHQAGGGNWVIHEAKAQLMLGMFYPEFKDAAVWLERGLNRTRAELDAQVLGDGIHIERTPGYHGGCLETFVSVLQLLALNDVAFEGRDHFLSRIEKMVDFYLYGIKPDGTMPVLGDTGKARYRPTLERAYKRFHRPDFLYVASEGKQGVPPVDTSHAFPTAGLYAMRSDWEDSNALWLFCDAGGFYGHCHLDNLTFELYAYGRTLLAEGGRYAYAAKINQYFKGTIGHNTILIDRENMEREPAPECVAWIPAEQFDYLHVRHQAYPGLTHDRRILFVKPVGVGADGYWIVVDDVTGPGEHRCDQRFHFEPALTAETNDLQARSNDKEGANLLIAAPAESPGLALTLEDGWVSYLWYGKRSAQVAQFTRQGPLPIRFSTVLYPERPEQQASLQVSRVPVEGAVMLNIEGATGNEAFADVVLLRDEERGPSLTSSGLDTDARVAYVRRNAEGTPRRALIHGGTFVRAEGALLLRTPQPIAHASASWMPDAMQVDTAATESLLVRRPETTQTVILNGRQLDPAKIGPGPNLVVSPVQAQPERPIPRGPGKPDIRYEPPTTAETATTLLAHRVAPEQALPIFVEAETYSAEGGGGELETNSRKVNASRDAILRWDKGGHWVEWTVSVPVEADYALALRVATNHGRVVRRIEIDGELPDKRLAAVEFGYTGGWASQTDDWGIFVVGDAYKNPVPIHLTPGKHTLQLTNLKGSLNVDWLLFTPLKQPR
jgi:heparan-sulfate lyase